MNGLEVSHLDVEVAGRSVVEDLSLVARAGDKVGVVGRNGAGKTSLLRTVAGERQPAGGTVRIRGQLGYLRQDPRQHRAEDERDALAYVVEARGLRALSELRELARLGVEERPSD